jgi:hypothetical protein
VTEKEHTTFLNFWLEHFIFCGPSLAPTKNYLSLAYELAKGATVGLGKLFLGEVYMYLHLTSSSLLSQETQNWRPLVVHSVMGSLIFSEPHPKLPCSGR